jgi:hypothetical protein
VGRELRRRILQVFAQRGIRMATPVPAPPVLMGERSKSQLKMQNASDANQPSVIQQP